MKRFIALCLTALLLIFAVSCGDKEEPESKPQSSEPVKEIIADMGNDLTDPENSDYNSEEGALVKAETLKPREGKANGIDVSKWQGKIDWKRVKAAGTDFAVIRIGFRGEDGKIYKDTYADYNIQQADKAGVLVGVYFFSTAKTTAEAAEEASWVSSAIAGYPISYPVVYNCEGFLNADSRMYGLSNTSRTDNAVKFLSEVKKAGYEAMFYAAKTELENSKYWDTARLESDYMIWVARYPATPYPTTPDPDYYGKYDMWQYTDKGIVSGIEGNTDMVVSYFKRDKKAPKNSALRPDDTSAPAVDNNKIYSDVSDEVTAKIEVNLRDGATTKSNIVGKLKNGSFLKRSGIGSNGYSRLIYNGKTVYAITSYLTTDRGYKPPEAVVSDGFESVNDKVTAKEKTNLRAEPDEAAELVATIYNGEFVSRIGKSPKGWSKLQYNGKTVYAKTSLLTDKVNTGTTQPPATDNFTPMSGKVTAKSTTNLRTGPTVNGTEIVYTLKYGEFVERTGEHNGWTRISYNGQTVYAVSSYLLTENEYNETEAEK